MNLEPRTVFELVSRRLGDRASDIYEFARTKYSFEEWCNWEAFAACRASELAVTPRPAYRLFNSELKSRQADLAVTFDDGHRVVVEVALVHDGTMDKWIEKIDWDTEKLRSIRSENTTGLQLIVAASTKGLIGRAENWTVWFQRTRRWGTPPEIQFAERIGEGGELMIFGWTEIYSAIHE